MAENNRLTEAENIISAFSQIMRAHRKEVQCTITSATALNDHTFRLIANSLQKKLRDGQKLSISTKVDPSIYGGIIIDLPDKRVDMSVSSKIQNISSSLRSSI